MNALFREEQAYTTRLFRSAPRTRGRSAPSGAPTTMRRPTTAPQLDCVMFTRDEVPFCRVCQRALEQVIDLYAGPRHTRVRLESCHPSSTSRPCGTSPRRC